MSQGHDRSHQDATCRSELVSPCSCRTLAVRQSVTKDSKVSLLWPRPSISATSFDDLALLSAYCPLSVLQTKYTCRPAGSCIALLDRPSPDLLRPQEFQIAYAQAVQPKRFGGTVPAAGSAFVPGATLTLHLPTQPFTTSTPLTSKTCFLHCFGSYVTAFIVWTPRVGCEGMNGRHDTSKLHPLLKILSARLCNADRLKLGASDRCVSFALCLFTQSHRQHAVQEAYRTAQTVGNRAARRWVAQRRMTSTLILACATMSMFPSTATRLRNIYSKNKA